MATAVRTIAPELVGVWDIDPAHSNLEAVARYAMVSSTRGRFAVFSGTITVGEQLTDSKVEVEIDAASVDTRNETRDGHLRSEDFLWVDEHPIMTFVSTRLEPGQGDDEYRMWGDLTMRGVTKQVELDVEFTGTAVDAWGNTRAGIEAKGSLNRKDWGLNWNAALEAGGVLVGDKLKLELNISAIKHKDA